MPRAKLVALLLTSFARLAHADPTQSSGVQAPASEAERDAPTPTPGPASTATPAEPLPPPASAAPVVPPPVPISAPAAPATPTGSARVRVAVKYADAWLETRPFGAEADWQRRCKAPCGEWLPVEGAEVRVTATGMTPTSAFRIEPGGGSALLTVNGGSALARSLGRIGLIAGVPLSLVGMAGFGYGHFDDRRGLETAGIVSLATGAALVLVALPLLVSGTTSVRNEKGDLIANQTPNRSLF
ncbi:MAG: hypothetical protein ACOY0T_04550 [Myxococcota bacterium]